MTEEGLWGAVSEHCCNAGLIRVMRYTVARPSCEGTTREIGWCRLALVGGVSTLLCGFVAPARSTQVHVGTLEIDVFDGNEVTTWRPVSKHALGTFH